MIITDDGYSNKIFGCLKFVNFPLIIDQILLTTYKWNGNNEKCGRLKKNKSIKMILRPKNNNDNNTT